jgi:peptidoglycan/LPS O-acetylase OafA/YrhL
MRRELGYVEGLRGIAALIVCAFHFALIFLPALCTPDAAKSWVIGQRVFASSPLNLVLNGGFAVSLFFVLSGFVLSHAFMQDGDPTRIWKAAAKRYPRLMLPMLVSLLIAWGVEAADGFYYEALKPLSGSPMDDIFVDPPSLFSVLREGTFGTFFEGDSRLNPPVWTIAAEFKGSFLVFALMIIFRRSRYRWIGYALSAAFLYDRYFLAFPIGMALAALQSPNPPRYRVASILFIIAVVLGSYPLYGAEDGIWYWLPTPGTANPLIFYQIIGAACLLEAVVLSPVQGILGRPFFRFLGRISYSIYLIHFTILSSLTCFLVFSMNPIVGYLSSVAIAFAITLPILLSAAYFFTRVIDEPATMLADWYARLVVSLFSLTRDRPSGRSSVTEITPSH